MVRASGGRRGASRGEHTRHRFPRCLGTPSSAGFYTTKLYCWWSNAIGNVWL